LKILFQKIKLEWTLHFFKWRRFHTLYNWIVDFIKQLAAQIRLAGVRWNFVGHQINWQFYLVRSWIISSHDPNPLATIIIDHLLLATWLNRRINHVNKATNNWFLHTKKCISRYEQNRLICPWRSWWNYIPYKHIQLYKETHTD
jgi:hypothetical protein